MGGTEGPCLPCGREGSHKCKMAEPINKKISTECTDSPGRILRSSATVDTIRADDYVDVIQGAAQQANPSSSVEIPNYRLQSNMHQGQSNHAPSLCLCIGKDGGHRKNAYLGQRAARSAVVDVEAGAAPGRCNDTSHVAAHNGLYNSKRVLLVSLFTVDRMDLVFGAYLVQNSSGQHPTPAYALLQQGNEHSRVLSTKKTVKTRSIRSINVGTKYGMGAVSMDISQRLRSQGDWNCCTPKHVTQA